jgi:hypothetical protein
MGGQSYRLWPRQDENPPFPFGRQHITSAPQPLGYILFFVHASGLGLNIKHLRDFLGLLEASFFLHWWESVKTFLEIFH